MEALEDRRLLATMDEAEPNDFLSQANPIELELNMPMQVIGETAKIGGAQGDVGIDLYAIDLDGFPAQVTIRASIDSFPSPSVDVQNSRCQNNPNFCGLTAKVVLFDAMGQIVRDDDDHLAICSGNNPIESEPLDLELQHDISGGTTYYLGVSAEGTNDGTDHNGDFLIGVGDGYDPVRDNGRIGGSEGVYILNVEVTAGGTSAGGPTLEIVDVEPDPRDDGVEEITLRFSEPVTGFSKYDLLLTSSTQTTKVEIDDRTDLTTEDNITWTLVGLDKMDLTDRSGFYTLELNPMCSGIQDMDDGNRLVSAEKESWSYPIAVQITGVEMAQAGSVDEISFAFDQAVKNFRLSDLRLSRVTDSVTSFELEPNRATLQAEDGPQEYRTNWTLGNLRDELTQGSGNYTLTLFSSTIRVNRFDRVFVNAEVKWTQNAGDSDEDWDFDQLDLVKILAAGKYLTGEAASWGEGDWNGDGVFDSGDIVLALLTGIYLSGPFHAGDL